MKTQTIGGIATIYDGPHATPRRRDTGAYFLNIASLSAGRLNLELSDHVDRADFERWTRRVQPQRGDLLFSYETRLGEAALMPDNIDACLGRRMALLRPNESVVDPRFLLYYYLSPDFQKVIASRSIHGATVSRIPLNQMAAWPVALPDRASQFAIVTVLGALDDKIAGNTALARTADELAQAHFSSWVPDLPKVSLAALSAPILGGTPARRIPEFWGSGNLWATARDVAAAPSRVVLTTAETITLVASAGAKRLQPHPAGTVVLTARGTVGAVARLAEPSAINQSCYAFHAPAGRSALMFFAVLRAVERMRAMAHGSVFSTITMSTLDKIQVPDIRTVSLSQADLAESLLDVVTQAARENSSLVQLRDTLLPALMSGRLRVKDAERQVEDAV